MLDDFFEDEQKNMSWCVEDVVKKIRTICLLQMDGSTTNELITVQGDSYKPEGLYGKDSKWYKKPLKEAKETLFKLIFLFFF